MPAEPDRSAPTPPGAPALLGEVRDPARLVCLPSYDEAACSAALVALANTSGGYLLVGATRDPETGELQPCDVQPQSAVPILLMKLAAEADPPLTAAVTVQTATFDGVPLPVATVQRSVQTPHIDSVSGTIFALVGGAVEPVRRRKEMDALYRRGAAAEERARRTLDGMVEQLQLASFGHYGIAALAALLQPSAVPHAAWREQPTLLADEGDPFVREWNLGSAEATVRTSWVELRLERELTGVLRVTRAGCAAAGETRSLPADKVLGTKEDLLERVRTLVDSACRLLAPSEDALILPRLLCEGLRTTRVRTGLDAERLSPPAAEDVLDLTTPPGDATDPDYRCDIVEAFATELAAFYRLDVAAG